MKNNLFNSKSKIGNYLFEKMLSWLDNPTRLKFGNPEKLIIASGIKKGQRVLEIGCGSGFFTPVIADVVGEDGFVDAVDLHPSAIEETKKKLDALQIENVQVQLADAHQTDYNGEIFDAVILYGVVPAPVISEYRLAQEMFRLLKPGGSLSVWTLTPFWTPKRFLKASSFISSGTTMGVHRLKKSAA